MKLYFVRHATAARKSTWRKDDDLRPLTRMGRIRFRDRRRIPCRDRPARA